MTFPARNAGTCVRCGRPYSRGDSITAATGPNVVPQRFRHSACPDRAPVVEPGRRRYPPPKENDMTDEQVEQEAQRMLDAVATGDAAAARRLAELTELMEDRRARGITCWGRTAEQWWRKAAEMGDLDAKHYAAHVYGSAQ